MILSMAHAEIPEARHSHLLGSWSDLVVGDRPPGLVAAYLVSDGDNLKVAAVWESLEAHEQALDDEQTHPAFNVFEAAGADPSHAVMRVIGSLHG